MTGESVVPRRPRPPEETVEMLAGFDAATVAEAGGGAGAMCSGVRAMTSAGHLVGTAFTVQCRPGDNLAIHRAIYMAEPGDVLVVAVDGHTEAGLWGEIMTVAAIERGIKGLVTDGAVRDVEAINRLGFPVFARAVCMRGTRKDDLGTVAQPISIGGVAVSPGDVVIGDSDGIVVVPQHRAAEVCDLSRLRQEKEETIKRRLREGKSTLELYGFDAKIPRGSGGLSSAR